MAALSKFPEFAKATNYKTPNSVTDGPLQYAYNTQHNMFKHLEAHPPYSMQFNNHMGGYHQGRPSWMDEGLYPVKERLIEGAQAGPDAPFLVDIAGGVGHDLDEFRRKVPHVPGRLVLQDLASIIEQANRLDCRIEKMVYDFYTEQPVRGEFLLASQHYLEILIVSNTDQNRRPRVLHALNAARLARCRVRQDPGTRERSHDARLLATADQ